jgi:hypothetical protein
MAIPQQTLATLPGDAPAAVRALYAAGEYLHGEQWRRPLAYSLGPYYPDGPRERIDPRLVSRWAAGQRDIPMWALRGLRKLLESKSNDIAQILAKLDAVPGIQEGV